MERLVRFSLYLINQFVRLPVVELQRSFRTDDAEMLRIHAAGIDCGNPHTTDDSVIVVHEHVSIILERCTALHEALAIAEDFLNTVLRANELRHVERVRGEIAENEGRTGLCRVDAPFLTFCFLISQRITTKAMRVAKLDHVDIANHAVLDHLAHLQEELEAREAIGYANNLTLLLSELLDLFALLNLEEQRLLADYMEACIECCLCDLIMREVRRSDGYDFDAIWAFRFFFEHGLVVRIEAILCHTDILTEILAAIEINIESAREQLVCRIVTKRARAMLISDLTSTSATNDAPTKRSLDFFLTI